MTLYSEDVHHFDKIFRGDTVKKAFEVTLLDRKFTLRSDSDEKYVQKVANFVNKRFFDIQNQTQSVSSLNVALLAALNIADDLFKIKDKDRGGSNLAQEKIREIITLIDRHVQA